MHVSDKEMEKWGQIKLRLILRSHGLQPFPGSVLYACASLNRLALACGRARGVLMGCGQHGSGHIPTCCTTNPPAAPPHSIRCCQRT